MKNSCGTRVVFAGRYFYKDTRNLSPKAEEVYLNIAILSTSNVEVSNS